MTKSKVSVLVSLLVLGVVGMGTAPAGASVKAASGAPIKLGYITTPEYLSYAPQGAMAAIKAINASGGVHGRPLQLVTCSNQDNANSAAACARTLASNPSIIATVGDVSSYGSSTNPPLQAVQVAGIGTSPLGSGDFAAQRVFPNNNGGLEFIGLSNFAYDTLRAKAIGMVGIDTPTAQALPTLINQVSLVPRNSKLASVASIPLTGSAGLSSQAAAESDTDAQLLALTENLEIEYIQAASQQGYKGPFLVSEVSATPGQLKQALPAADLKNLYAVTYFNRNSQGFAHFLADMKKYEPNVPQPGDLSAISWLGAETFATVANHLTSVTRQDVYNAMSHLVNFSTDGMTAKPLSYTLPGTALGGSAPRVVPSVQYVYMDKYQNGKYVPISKHQTAISLFGAPHASGTGG